MGKRTNLGRVNRVAWLAALAGGVLVVSPRAAAQEGGEASAGAEDEPRLPRPASETKSVRPVRRGGVEGVRPGLTGGEDWSGDAAGEGGPRRVLAEGTFLSGRAGRVVRGPAGRVIFVPGREDRAEGESAMLVLPSATLERLERAMQLDPTLERVSFTGQVTVYDGRNYLLPSRYARLGVTGALDEGDGASANDDETSEGETRQGESRESEEAPPALRDDPEVRELIEALEARPRGVMGQEREPGSAPAEEEAVGVVRAPAEGTAMVRRRGRLVRDGSGGWTLRFDNGPETGAGDEPLGVLPCMLLMRMEARAMEEGDDLDMLVSGRIYSYRGRGYVLPTLMQLVPRGGIDPLQ